MSDINIVFKTNKGDIAAVVFASKVPVTSASFLNLARRGFYNGLTFHRVIANFMIQGGDPTGTGGGGPGYRFEDETLGELKHNRAGILSMANSDRGKAAYTNAGRTNGSQFFITHKPTPHLDGLHTVFGKVTEGQDVVDAIEQGDTIDSIEIKDSIEALLKQVGARVDEWNEIIGPERK